MSMTCGKLLLLSVCVMPSCHARRIKQASDDLSSAEEGLIPRKLQVSRSPGAAGKLIPAGFSSQLSPRARHPTQRLDPMFMMNPHAGAAVRDTGFVEEMRRVAMRLHSPQQSKQGKKEATKKEEMSPMEWKPTVEGYLNFLVESKVVYNTFESLMKNAPADSAFQDFTNTGLERSEGLEKDIAWLSQKYGLEVPVAKGAGVEYAKFLTDLAKKDEAAFLCHFYNFQFAHSAGGRMIGRKVSEMLLDGKELEFYKWEDLDGSRARTKEKINLLAEGLSQEEKDRCLEETAAAFDMSGKLLRNIAQ